MALGVIHLLKASALILLVLATIAGNLLVIVAVFTRKKLRQSSQLTAYLIISLGVADLCVGVLVLPFSTAIQLHDGRWSFGAAWCHSWLAIDVWMCTASIYNLTAISIDRYVAVSRPLQYHSLVTPRMAKLLVGSVWVLSLGVAVPPLIGQFIYSSLSPWNSNETDGIMNGTEYNEEEYYCTPLNNKPIYIVMSASASFFIPMVIIIILHSLVYRVVHQSANQFAKNCLIVKAKPATTDCTISPAVENDVIDNGEPEKSCSPKSCPYGYHYVIRQTSCEDSTDQKKCDSPFIKFDETNTNNNNEKEYKNIMNFLGSKESLEMSQNCKDGPPRMDATAPDQLVIKSGNLICSVTCPIDPDQQRSDDMVKVQILAPKNLHNLEEPRIISTPLHKFQFGTGNYQERRRRIEAANTVAIVTGCFLLSWIGFSVVYFLRAFEFCRLTPDCIPPTLFNIFFWLGYFNSALNPLIYALFNRDFRAAFRQLLAPWFCPKKDEAQKIRIKTYMKSRQTQTGKKTCAIFKIEVESSIRSNDNKNENESKIDHPAE